MSSDIKLPIVFHMSVLLLWTCSQKNVHTLLQLEDGNNGAVGIFEIKRLFLFYWIVVAKQLVFL